MELFGDGLEPKRGLGARLFLFSHFKSHIVETTVIFILLIILVIAVFALWIAILKTNENVRLLGMQMISFNEKLKNFQAPEVNQDEKNAQEIENFYKPMAINMSDSLSRYLGKPTYTSKDPHTTVRGYPIHCKWKAWGKDSMYIWEVWPKKWEDQDQWQCFGVGTLKPIVPPSAVLEEVLDELKRLDAHA